MDSQLLDAPLKGKNFRIEFNFVKLLMLSSNLDISGGFSLFNVDRKAEISFPIAYKKHNSSNLSQFTIDTHYRRFLSQRQTGFYSNAFARYAQLKGTLGDDYLFPSDSNQKFILVTIMISQKT